MSTTTCKHGAGLTPVAIKEFTRSRGRNADSSGDAQGEAEFSLMDTDGSSGGAFTLGEQVLVYDTTNSTDTALFYGFVQRIKYDPWGKQAIITCRDPLRLLSEPQVDLTGAVPHTAREWRAILLGAAVDSSTNFCLNGGFDCSDVTGWHRGFKNLVPTFSSGAWVTTADAFHAAGSAVGVAGTGSLPTPPEETYALRVTTSGADNNEGAHAPISYTFKSGVAYRVTGYIYRDGYDYQSSSFGIGSQGTPADYAFATVSYGAWRSFSFTWTPSSDRTDVHVFTRQAGKSSTAIYLESLRVTVDDSTLSGIIPAGCNWGTNPDMGAAPTTFATSTAQHKFGLASLSVSGGIEGGAHSGVVYDLAGAVLPSSGTVTISAWIYPSNTTTFHIKLLNKGNEYLNGSGSCSANTWTKITASGTPGALDTATLALQSMVSIAPPDNDYTTYYVDGVKVVSGTSTDFEPVQFSEVATGEDDIIKAGAKWEGGVLSCLAKLNTLTMSRHYIKPQMTSPYWSYVVGVREDLSAKTSAETFNDDFTGFDLEYDIDSVLNSVSIKDASATNLYQDATSIATYGLRSAASIDGSGYWAGGSQAPGEISTAILLRYKVPRGRPSLDVVGMHDRILAREVDDLITINCARLGISAKKYLIVSISATLAEGGVWAASYGLEEHAY
jgi:hypothetical protein